MPETKGMTAEERVNDIHEALSEAKSFAEEKFLIGEAIKQAEERGRVEMRERCAAIADHEENTMRARISSGPYDAAYLDGYADGAHVCAGFIRALPTSEEEATQESQSDKEG